ncbi:MAG: N-acetylmuramoyl-L-alanine amidase, partial [Aristaeellaceae bacterium]
MIRRAFVCLLAVAMAIGCAAAEVIEIQGTVAVENVTLAPDAVAQDVTIEPTATSMATPQPTAEPTATPEPTEAPRLYGLRIGIDPGHQVQANYDKEPIAPGSSETKAKVASGTSGVRTGISEYVTDLEIALKLRDALEAEGCTVYMTREVNEIDISNLERAEMMNELGVDLVLRIHCDGATDKSANGIGMFVRQTGEKQAESEAAAKVLLEAMSEATGAKARGVFLR